MVGRPSKRENSPPAADKRWAGWTRPVLEYLTKPQTWEDLLAWAEANKMGSNRLRNCICWLESNTLIIDGRDDEGLVTWRQCGWLIALGELPAVLDGQEVDQDGQQGKD